MSRIQWGPTYRSGSLHFAYSERSNGDIQQYYTDVLGPYYNYQCVIFDMETNPWSSSRTVNQTYFTVVRCEDFQPVICKAPASGSAVKPNIPARPAPELPADMRPGKQGLGCTFQSLFKDLVLAFNIISTFVIPVLRLVYDGLATDVSMLLDQILQQQCMQVLVVLSMLQLDLQVGCTLPYHAHLMSSSHAGYLQLHADEYSNVAWPTY